MIRPPPDWLHAAQPPGRPAARRKGRGEGDGADKKELFGNMLADTVTDLCWRLHSKDRSFSIENTKGSYVWGYGPM